MNVFLLIKRGLQPLVQLLMVWRIPQPSHCHPGCLHGHHHSDNRTLQSKALPQLLESGGPQMRESAVTPLHLLTMRLIPPSIISAFPG